MECVSWLFFVVFKKIWKKCWEKWSMFCLVFGGWGTCLQTWSTVYFLRFCVFRKGEEMWEGLGLRVLVFFCLFVATFLVALVALYGLGWVVKTIASGFIVLWVPGKLRTSLRFSSRGSCSGTAWFA